MSRFILEGTWTGYVSSQSRVCHREIVSKKRAEKLRGLHKIVYTDGTSLLIHVREAEYREKVKEIFSYRDLIREAEAKGDSVVLVSELKA
jgi:uncharacterized Zn ribbon protein